MHTDAIVLNGPESLALRQVELTPPGEDDVVVRIDYSGISTGTERLLYTGRMPPFPGMGYPLVPGYESAGHVVAAGSNASLQPGAFVFVPGASCYGPIRGLFGGAARTLVTPAARVTRLPEHLGEQATLLALAATAQHAIAALASEKATLPDLIVGHGTLGRLIARLAVLAGGAPTAWENLPARRAGAQSYAVVDPAEDTATRYRAIIDVSGDAGLLDTLIASLAPGGAIVLAGFYDAIHFAFPPAFMREVRLLIAAQWAPSDLAFVAARAADGTLDLGGLITHRAPAADAPGAYRTAFTDPACLKMSLDWSACA